MNLAEIIDYWVRWQPDRCAVRFVGRSVTWRELARMSDAVAGVLVAHGTVRGDRVGLLMHNRPEFLAVVVASMKLGAIVVPLNVRLAAPELAYAIDHAGCRVVTADDQLLAAVRGVTVAGAAVPVLDADEIVAATASAPPVPAVALDADAPLSIAYTSGTTGRPKGAVLTHGSWDHSLRSHCLQHGLGRDDRVLLPYPMAFTGGFATALMAYWTGGTLVLEPAFDAGRALWLIEHEWVTQFGGVPIIFQQIADHPAFAETDLSSIRIATTGGAPVPLPLLRQFLDRGVCLIQNYSLTEVSAGGSSLPPHDAVRKIGSAGVSAMSSETRICDEYGEMLGVGDVGEICIRGPEVMSAYWNDAEATAATIRDGWCCTGDLGYLDDEGYLFVVDRKKDMLISGGLNVYPAEIEQVLGGLPNVVELTVVGVPDRRWGEVPAVIVCTNGMPPPTGGDVMAACRDQLADFKLPRYLVVRTEPLPRSMSGKVRKRALQEELADLQDRAQPIR